MNTLEYAIKMELDGEIYYSKQMEINKNNSLYVVCRRLAEDEKRHAGILDNKMQGLPYELKNTDTLTEAQNIFAAMSDQKTVEKEIFSQLDFYRIALDLEKQSINLYTDFYGKATKGQDKELFKYLIEQEKKHYELLDELVLLLSHAEEWVENAEFGIRKDY